MISTAAARTLREAGLRWHPTSGDAFRIERPDFDGDVFTVSDMTIEPHEFDTGTILGFNGTTEWALDSLSLEHALWMPREHQLREQIGTSFRSLSRLDDGTYRVVVDLPDGPAGFDAPDPADAYAAALLAVIDRAGRPHPGP